MVVFRNGHYRGHFGIADPVFEERKDMTHHGAQTDARRNSDSLSGSEHIPPVGILSGSDKEEEKQ